MGEVVNLNKFRKRQLVENEGKRAAENRSKFSRSRVEIEAVKAEQVRLQKELDGKKKE